MNHESHSECSMPTHTVQIASVHDALNIEVVCLVFALVCVNAVVGKCIAFSIDDGALVHEKETSHGRSSNPNRVCSGWMCVRVSDFLANTSFNIACGSMCPVCFTLNPTHSSMAHLHWIYSCENVKKQERNETVSGIDGLLETCAHRSNFVSANPMSHWRLWMGLSESIEFAHLVHVNATEIDQFEIGKKKSHIELTKADWTMVLNISHSTFSIEMMKNILFIGNILLGLTSAIAQLFNWVSIYLFFVFFSHSKISRIATGKWNGERQKLFFFLVSI